MGSALPKLTIDRPRHCTAPLDPKRPGYICAAHIARTSTRKDLCTQHANDERETDK